MPPTPDWLDRYFAARPLPAPLTPEESIVAKLTRAKCERVLGDQAGQNAVKDLAGLTLECWRHATPDAQLAELERLGGLT